MGWTVGLDLGIAIIFLKSPFLGVKNSYKSSFLYFLRVPSIKSWYWASPVTFVVEPPKNLLFLADGL